MTSGRWALRRSPKDSSPADSVECAGLCGGGGGIRTPGPLLRRPFISSEVQSASLARLQIIGHETVSKEPYLP